MPDWPTFNPGDRVWQHAHAPDGYRFEVVDTKEAPNGETLCMCRVVGVYEVETSDDADDNLVRTPLGVRPIDDGETVDIRASALAHAED